MKLQLAPSLAHLCDTTMERMAHIWDYHTEKQKEGTHRQASSKRSSAMATCRFSW